MFTESWSTGTSHRSVCVLLEGEAIFEMAIERGSGKLTIERIGPRAEILAASGRFQIFRDAATVIAVKLDREAQQGFFAEFFQELRRHAENAPDTMFRRIDYRA